QKVPSGGNNEEVRIVGFDGTGDRSLVSFGDNSSHVWGMSDDGKLLAAHSTLYKTDGTDAFELALTGGTFSGDPLTGIDSFYATMSGSGKRFMYFHNAAHRVATLEIDPASTGAAPATSNPPSAHGSIPA